MSGDFTTNLRKLPPVDEVLRDEKFNEVMEKYPRELVVNSIRQALEEVRSDILNGKKEPGDREKLKQNVVHRSIDFIQKSMLPGLRRVINATGVVIHTNLGRALLSEDALEAVNNAAMGYSNLEFNLETGKRGSRYDPLESIIKELTGAEAALVVNNNASAVLLALGTLAYGREVIVSRGQLVEIGGSFRIPDVMKQSSAELVEVGTTNKTYPRDYENAITENTGLLLNVHTSNYRIVGFTRETSVKELVELGKKYNLPVMSDLGSGSIVDLQRLGLPYEPTVGEIVDAGVDVVTFSGDKLLGGPQAGIIAGEKEIIDRMKKNPLTRAIRIDKFTVAALEATLREYRDIPGALKRVPTLRMLSAAPQEIRPGAERLLEMCRQLNPPGADFDIVETVSRVGGGALPTAELPSVAVELTPRGVEAESLAANFRECMPAVIGRIQDDRILFDMRTVQENEIDELYKAIKERCT